MKRISAFGIIALAILVVPAFAADRVIYNGSDLWRTVGNGSTYADFSKTPIPAGFFCNKSEPFTGRIGFKGIPVATSVPGALGLTDTIVQRLDDAAFNKNGVAFTRLQVRSLNFESISPIKTACGLFTAKVALDGEQPITRMRIVRESAAGGRFFAPIHVNVKLSFEPVGRVSTEALEVRKALRFPPARLQEWSVSKPVVEGFVKVDTDSDGILDTFLPGGTSGFMAGLSAAPQKYWDTVSNCHIEDEGQHCPVVYNVAIESSPD